VVAVGGSSQGRSTGSGEPRASAPPPRLYVLRAAPKPFRVIVLGIDHFVTSLLPETRVAILAASLRRPPHVLADRCHPLGVLTRGRQARPVGGFKSGMVGIRRTYQQWCRNSRRPETKNNDAPATHTLTSGALGCGGNTHTRRNQSVFYAELRKNHNAPPLVALP
jgi:hypothetical protein